MLGATGREHGEITLGKDLRGILVNRIHRVHQAIDERISVDIERRMDEVRNVHPEIFVSRADVDGRPETFTLHAEPDLADALRRQFTVLALGTNSERARIDTHV